MSTRSSARRTWSLERALFLMAGLVTALSAALAAWVSPWFLLLTAFVAASQLMFVTVGFCPSSLVLQRVCRLRPAGQDAR